MGTMEYYIILKSGTRYNFNQVRTIRTEQKGKIEVLVISGQRAPRERYRDVRLLKRTIKDTNIPKLEKIL